MAVVLHILLGVLKIAGILFVILFGILLLVVCCLLFCPVVYQGFGEKKQDSMKGNLKISWLFHGISLKIWYEESIHYSLRLIGIPIERLRDIFKKRVGKKSEINQPEEFTAVEENRRDAEKREHVGQGAKEALRREIKEAEKRPLKKKKFLKKRKKHSFQDLRLTLKKICDKIRKVKIFLESEQIGRTKIWLIKEMKALIFHIKPKKLKGNVQFGMEDPYLTGEILAVLGVFYPLYGEYFTIEPFFEEKILEGNLTFRGRIYGVYFAFLAWRVFQNKDLRFIIKKIKYL